MESAPATYFLILRQLTIEFREMSSKGAAIIKYPFETSLTGMHDNEERKVLSKSQRSFQRDSAAQGAFSSIPPLVCNVDSQNHSNYFGTVINRFTMKLGSTDHTNVIGRDFGAMKDTFHNHREREQEWDTS